MASRKAAAPVIGADDGGGRDDLNQPDKLKSSEASSAAVEHVQAVAPESEGECHQLQLPMGDRSSVLGARPRPLAPRLTVEEVEAHRRFVATLGKKAIWRAYSDEVPHQGKSS